MDFVEARCALENKLRQARALAQAVRRDLADVNLVNLWSAQILVDLLESALSEADEAFELVVKTASRKAA